MVNAITAIWLLLVITMGNLERQHLARTLRASENVKVGDSEANVYDLLGPPIAKYDEYEGWSLFGMGAHPKQWCYGTNICLENIFIVDSFVMVSPLPVNIRWFRYAEDDLVIDWSNDRHVLGFTKPKREYAIDHGWDAALKTCYTGFGLYRTLLQAQR
jgi:hypothetical protein